MSQSLSIDRHEPLKIKIQSRTAKVGVIGMESERHDALGVAAQYVQ